jgi:hypothetical protein
MALIMACSGDAGKLSCCENEYPVLHARLIAEPIGV